MVSFNFLIGFSTVSAREENQGIRDLYCDFSFAIWPRPPNQPTTTTTTPTTTTTTIATSTNQQSTMATNMATDAPPRPGSTGAVPTSATEYVKAEKKSLKDSSSSLREYL